MIKYVDAKQVLQKNKTLDWFGADYCVNLYRGCAHGCIYCDSRSSCYNDFEFDTIKPKRNAIEILEKELCSKKKKGIIDTGAMNDPYNALELKLEYTKNFLILADRYGFGVSITTKSDAILRDTYLLKQIAKKNPVICEFTITTTDDNLCQLLEPRAPVSSKRFDALKKLVDEDLFAGIVLMPVLPFIEDTPENIDAIVEKAASAGAHFIYPYFGVTLRHNQREYYYQQLNKIFPKADLHNKYMSYFGNQYECISPRIVELQNLFETKCRKYNILFKMDEIVMCYKKRYESKQLSIFDYL